MWAVFLLLAIATTLVMYFGIIAIDAVLVYFGIALGVLALLTLLFVK